MTKKLHTTALSPEFKKKLLEQKNTYIAARSSKIQQGTADKIIENIKEFYKLETNEEALAIIAMLFQQGGTARSCDGNMNIVLFEKNIKLAEIRKILKQQSCNRAERKLARTFANEIYEIAVTMEISGNLYNKIQKNNIERKFSIEEKAWLSDFQADNENCPIELRNLIIETFKKTRK